MTGGRSAEHSVALASSQNIRQGLNTFVYDVTEFVISRKGQWNFTSQQEQHKEVISSDIMEAVLECDLMFPVFHGPYGEDGTIQGFFEVLGIPYIGMNYRSSAICMDKVVTKKLLGYHEIPTLPFIGLSAYEWRKDPEEVKERIEKALHYPIFVKAAHLGSSIGVYKVQREEDLNQTMEKALEHDTHFIIENGISMRELEFAVLGNDTVTVFPPGEILTGGDVYSYDVKYGEHGMKTSVAPELDEKVMEQGMDLARKAFAAVGGDGMARVDFFLDESGQYWCNEINPIPGFTDTSLYPKLCEKHGLILSDLLDRLIELGLQRHRNNCLVREIS